MNSFISLISDADLHKEFTRDIRDRYLDQKFLYSNPENADRYYELHHANKSKIIKRFVNEDYYEFLKKNLGKKKQHIAFVSLGCGNAEKEKIALSKLTQEGWEFFYIGVDASERMLELAEKNLSNLPFEQHFIKTDFIDDAFKDEIVELTKHSDRRLLSFLGNTLGNVNQTNIADILYNSLDKGDLLWLDVVVRRDLSMENEMKTFNRYASYLKDDEVKRFFFAPLADIKVPFDSGEIMMKMDKEYSVGAIIFTFYFHFNEKVVLSIDNEKVHFLPAEEIKLQKIRVYHPETMIKFFNEHEFNLVNHALKGEKGQFMFIKGSDKDQE